jgi:perosamine synthetase
VLYLGATPVFVDVSIETWCSPSKLIREAVTEKTKAIIAVHNYGLVDDIVELARFCKEKGIFLIEDAAEGLGGKFNSQFLGTFGDIGTFSFYGNKIITSGEGGAVVTNNVDLMSRMKYLRGQAMNPNRRYFFDEVGYNFRLSNVSSAILLAQLSKLPYLLQERERVFLKYEEYLSELKAIQFPVQKPNTFQAPWLFTVLVGSHRDLVAERLAKLGIETRPTFYPIPDLPAFQPFEPKNSANTSIISKNGLSLPTFAGMKEREISFVCDSLTEVLNGMKSIE